jgi:peroxiredoxin Q/BCP
LPATNQKIFKAQEYQEHQDCGLILYFYPKDSTPGCTVEGQEFAKLYPQFKKMKYEIFGISRDSLKSHEKFKEKFQFPFELLSDEQELACKLFDVIKEKNMYGKKMIGIQRSTFLIKNGKIEFEWRGLKAQGHAAEVLEKLKNV